MKPLNYATGRYARDGVIVDFLRCFGGPDGRYLRLKKEFKTKASLCSICQQHLVSLLLVLMGILLQQKLNRIILANPPKTHQTGMI